MYVSAFVRFVLQYAFYVLQSGRRCKRCRLDRVALHCDPISLLQLADPQYIATVVYLHVLNGTRREGSVAVDGFSFKWISVVLYSDDNCSAMTGHALYAYSSLFDLFLRLRYTKSVHVLLYTSP